MTDYTNIVAALRCHGAGRKCYGCPFLFAKGDCSVDVASYAADAIEKLVTLYEKAEIDATNLTGKLAQAEAQLPKLGEIVRCKECIHFTQGGWCDREFDWFPVDENDFCSMAEKMEAQNG